MQPEWLRVKQVSEYCCISRRTVYSWFFLGLKYAQVGHCRLIRRSDLDSFIEQHMVGKTADDLADEILQEVS